MNQLKNRPIQERISDRTDDQTGAIYGTLLSDRKLKRRWEGRVKAMKHYICLELYSMRALFILFPWSGWDLAIENLFSVLMKSQWEASQICSAYNPSTVGCLSNHYLTWTPRMCIFHVVESWIPPSITSRAWSSRVSNLRRNVAMSSA